MTGDMQGGEDERGSKYDQNILSEICINSMKLLLKLRTILIFQFSSSSIEWM